MFHTLNQQGATYPQEVWVHLYCIELLQRELVLEDNFCMTAYLLIHT